jgi:hypothetical protein
MLTATGSAATGEQFQHALDHKGAIGNECAGQETPAGNALETQPFRHSRILALIPESSCISVVNEKLTGACVTLATSPKDEVAMRKVVILFGACLLSTTAVADTSITIPADAQRNFCIYNNRVFSVGAVVCIGNSRGQTCEAGDGNARARWSRSKDSEIAEACLDLKPETIK